jgi:hypothetical protein
LFISIIPPSLVCFLLPTIRKKAGKTKGGTGGIKQNRTSRDGGIIPYNTAQPLLVV